MLAWCFVSAGGDLWAITSREDGANLPETGAPWRPHKAVTLDGEDRDEREARALIEADGYCCFKPGDASE